MTVFRASDQLKRQRTGEASAVRHAVKLIAGHRPSRADTPAADSSDADDNESAINASSLSSASLSRGVSCGSCRKKDSQRWWKAPRGLDFATAVLCDACSMNWRKYADVKSSRTDDGIKVKGADKKDNTPLSAKRMKVNIVPPDVTMNSRVVLSGRCGR